jgi:hypothetical protein
MRALALAAAAALVWQPAALDDLIGRAGRYVVEYQDALALIVLEEHYVQSEVRPPGGPPRPTASGPRDTIRARRELRSDVLLVRSGDGLPWRTFRDTHTVDGRAVRDRDDRLVRLFLDTPRTAVDQAQAILAESARFNIGYIDRDINVPLLALAVLDPEHQARFVFERQRDEAVRGRRTARAVIRFREAERPTLIRTDGGRDLPVEGRFWLDPETGRVERSELVAEDRQLRATIRVDYAPDEDLGLWLPAEMREAYLARRSATTIDGRARYGNARRFEVTVTETIRPPG